MRRGAIDAIEAAYRTGGTTTEWMRGLAQAMPVRRTGLGFICYSYHITQTGQVAIDDQLAVDAPSSVLEPALGAVKSLPAEYVRETWARLPFATATTSGSTEIRAQTRQLLHHYFGRYNVRDIVITNGLDPTGAGVYIGELQSREVDVSRRDRATWSRVSAHLAASFRLRRSTSNGEAAVVSPNGAIAHAVEDATSRTAQDALRRAALAIDRARTKRYRHRDQEAVEIWRALVAGQWTLVDRMDSDGRRYYVARKNDPDVARHHALTRRERQVLGYVVLGHSNKLIAYEMGITTSSVAVYLEAAMAKLGTSSRAALIAAVHALGGA